MGKAIVLLSGIFLFFCRVNSVNAQNYKILHQFEWKTNDGSFPEGSLSLKGGTLYGMTNLGGKDGEYGFGIIFSIKSDGTDYQILHNFGGYPDDGGYPTGSLTSDGVRLYGMTSGGGYHYDGTIFSLDPANPSDSYTVIHEFPDQSIKNDGESPLGSLLLYNDRLYGMTSEGGEDSSSGHGVIFSIKPDGTDYEILHRFRIDIFYLLKKAIQCLSKGKPPMNNRTDSVSKN